MIMLDILEMLRMYEDLIRRSYTEGTGEPPPMELRHALDDARDNILCEIIRNLTGVSSTLYQTPG